MKDIKINGVPKSTTLQPTCNNLATGCKLVASDCISRRDAMAYPLSWDHYDKEHGNRHFIAGIESYREYIEALPSIDLGWIPCSKCLPKEGESAILRYSNGKISGGRYIGNRVWDVDYGDSDKTVSVIAWMWMPNISEERDSDE